MLRVLLVATRLRTGTVNTRSARPCGGARFGEWQIICELAERCFRFQLLCNNTKELVFRIHATLMPLHGTIC